MADLGQDQGEFVGDRLRLAFVLTALILLLEAIAGALSHSLALLSDAGHILTDVVALGLAWFAVVQAKRPADQRRTYGYHRVGILTAMLNGATDYERQREADGLVLGKEQREQILALPIDSPPTLARAYHSST